MSLFPIKVLARSIALVSAIVGSIFKIFLIALSVGNFPSFKSFTTLLLDNNFLMSLSTIDAEDLP